MEVPWEALEGMNSLSSRELVKRPKNPAAPKLPRSTPTLEILHLEDGQRFGKSLVRAAQLTDQCVRSLTFDACRLEQVNLSGGHMPRCTWIDCDLQGCNLANLEGEDSSLLRTTLSHCKLSGIRFSDAVWRDADLVECKLDYAWLHGLKAKNVRLLNCDLREAEFYGCRFESLQCLNCDLGRCSFSNCRFEICEFQGCDLTGLRGLGNLTGVRMQATDLFTIAVALAGELGIGVIPGE
jgi:uncharacterized protein YjbI with pentapeptide repeats